MAAPVLTKHDGIWVVRDDLHPGGTKARFLVSYFIGTDEVVYASPPEGGAQTAIAVVAASLGKRATLFVAKRKEPHARARMAARYGARVVPVAPGYMSVCQARARAYCAETGARLLPFGADMPDAIATIANTARSIAIEPDEVWCAAGSGVLSRAIALAWPRARRHSVQIGRTLAPSDVAGATIHVYPRPFGWACTGVAPFPCDPHYDAKAWSICKRAARPDGRTVVFWNVTGPAR